MTDNNNVITAVVVFLLLALAIVLIVLAVRGDFLNNTDPNQLEIEAPSSVNMEFQMAVR